MVTTRSRKTKTHFPSSSDPSAPPRVDQAKPLGVFQWLSAKEGDPKHLGWAHSVTVCILLYLSVVGAMVALTDLVAANYLPNGCPARLSSDPNSRYVCAGALATYIIVLFIVRVAATASSMAVYEFLWACNVSMVMASLGIATCRPLLVGASMISVSVDQVLWYVDVLGFLFTGKFIIGVAKYLTWKQTSWARRFTSTHHLWFIPYCMLAMGQIPLVSYPLSVIYVALIDILCRWVTPFRLHLPGKPSSKSGAATKSEKEEGSIQYLNVNLVYELWKDIKYKWLQLSHPSAHIHLFRLIIVWSLLNVPFTILLIPLSHLLSR